jgi:hypothetical protein
MGYAIICIVNFYRAGIVTQGRRIDPGANPAISEFTTVTVFLCFQNALGSS